MPKHDNRDRQNQMPDPIQDIVALSNRVRAAAWKQPKLHRKNQDKQKRHPEFRDAAGHRSDTADDPIRQAVFVPCTPDAKQQRQHKDKNKADATQNQCVADSATDHFQHIRLIFIRNPKISMQRVSKPADVLNRNRFVQPQLLLRPSPLLRAHFLHPVAVIRYQRITRRKS